MPRFIELSKTIFLCFMLCVSVSAEEGASSQIAYTEQRAPCSSYTPLRQPFFGDLHVHTKYSLDASTQGTRTSPEQAYLFAQGNKLGIQPWTENNKGIRSLQLSRPLDFAMVSDHAELIGEVYMCNTPGVEGYNSWQCLFYRYLPRGAFYLFNYMSSMEASHLGQCGEDGELCLQAARQPWREMQLAAEKNYDRSGDCSFTTFVGYEWTGVQSDSGGNLHRNVVFRNAEVPELPISYIDSPAAEKLWQALDEQCNSAQGVCDSIVIPHNSNMSAGYMFDGLGDAGKPMTQDYARRRMQFEPLVEIMQHKGASECFFKRGESVDELCAFEQLPVDNIAGFNNPPRPDTGFVREALGKGMSISHTLGVNPYQFGFIASTDTHLGTPGAVSESDFLGHGGAGVPARDKVPPGLPEKLEYNPGGLAVVWAEENSRDALFNALKRRETYGTSGPRIVSRFFAGSNFSDELCFRKNRIEAAYAQGVPMGGELALAEGDKPSFLLVANQDAGTADAPGTPLQRLQIIKGRLTESGRYFEEVVDVAGDQFNGAGVNTKTCETSGKGFAELCAVWVDDDFDPAEQAYYYSRVVENPTCRWSQRICVAKKVDCSRPETIGEGLEGCCAAEHQPVIQERAWSSPIWYKPPASGDESSSALVGGGGQ